MTSIPESFQGSPALQLITSQAWNWKVTTEPTIAIEICPYCAKDNWHFFMEIQSPSSEQARRDGLNSCKYCGKSGNLYSLKQHLGLTIPGVESRAEWAGKEIEQLPDIEVCHQALLEDIDALDYLINKRGFSRDIIEKQKLGLVQDRYFKSCGKVKALVYPYLVGNNCIWVHYRSLPPAPKDFSSPRGWDSVLYNGHILKDGIKEVVFVEGEANCVVALDHKIENICGVPGANFKKASWIDTLDKLDSLEKIYVCYDSDKVGSKAAADLATRIGIEKCWKIVLPEFMVVTEENETRKGKDLNEFFQSGGTVEAFNQLKQEAVLFDVDGVTSPQNALQELEDDILNHGVTPKYVTPWASLNKLVGFDDGEVVDLIAPAKVGKTTTAMNLLEFLVDTYNEDGVLICLEMTTVRLARKLVSHVAQIEDNIPKTIEDAEKLKKEFLKGIKFAKQKFSEREGDLYICYPHYHKMDDLYKLIVDIIRRYGSKFIVFDNIQRAADTTAGSKNRTQHLSEISKVLSQIAKDYGIILIRIIQPHQIKGDNLTSSNDADGSSQISKDCDCSITLDRNRLNEISRNDFESVGYIESEAAFGDKLLAKVDLSRYSGGGYVTLRYNGPTSTVTEYNMGEIAAIKAMAEKDVGHESQLQKLGALVKPVLKEEVVI
jgi:hypothetical protein